MPASLKDLHLSHHSMYRRDEATSYSIRFPLLRQLDITWESILGQSALPGPILTSPRLSTLATNYGHRGTRELLDRERDIWSLKTWVLHRSSGRIPDDSPLGFLKKNPHLKSFAFYSPETSTLQELTLSLLTTFTRLRKLLWPGKACSFQTRHSMFYRICHR